MTVHCVETVDGVDNMEEKSKNVIIWGYCENGVRLLKRLEKMSEYNYIGFGDNSPYKKGNYVNGEKIYGMDELIQLRQQCEFSVIISNNKWNVIKEQCEKNNIPVEAFFSNQEIHRFPLPSFESLDYKAGIRFYAGNIYDEERKKEKDLYGLSLHTHDSKHIICDIRKGYPIKDNMILSYEAEDVFEYIDKDDQIYAINEIWRILKPGGYARFCLPDCNSPWVKKRIMRNKAGEIVFDPLGGGDYKSGVIENGAVYFATYEDFNETLMNTKFKKIEWGCYYTSDGILHRNNIDMSLGNVRRLNCADNEVYSMVVDCWK